MQGFSIGNVTPLVQASCYSAARCFPVHGQSFAQTVVIPKGEFTGPVPHTRAQTGAHPVFFAGTQETHDA